MRLWHKQEGKIVPQMLPHLRLGAGSFWLENILLPLGLLALQALPLGALLQLGAAWNTNDAGQTLLPTWALLLLLAEAFYLARWLTGQSRFKGWLWFMIGSGGLATLVLVLYLRLYIGSGPFWQLAWPGVLFQDLQLDTGRTAALLGIVALLGLLWWHGLRLARGTIEHEQVARNFKGGFAALVAALLLIGTVSSGARDGLVVRLGVTMPLFLFVGLASLSLARLAEIQRARSHQGASQADPTRSWVIAMLVLSGALVLLMFGIEQAFSYHVLLGVVSTLKPIWDGFTAVVGWIAVGIAYVLYWVLSPLAQVVRSFFKANQQDSHPQLPVTPKNPHPKGNASALPADWLVIGHWVLIGIGIIMLLVILIRAYRGFVSWRHDEMDDEERENLQATRILGAQLRALLASLAARFQQKRSAEDEADALSRHSVRALYRRVLRQMAAQGLGRHVSETPHEFAQRLGPIMAKLPLPTPAVSKNLQVKEAIEPVGATAPGVSDLDLEIVTRAYEQARYGNSEPAAARMAVLASDVDRLLQRLAQSHTNPKK